MILKNVKTTYVAPDPWTSPDGKVTIWLIKFEHDGKVDTINTMSKVLAQEGWTGDMEIYTNTKGKDYARQAPKEEPTSNSGGGGGHNDMSEGMAWGNALTNATNLVIAFGPKDSNVGQATEWTLKAAEMLVEGRPDNKPEEKPEQSIVDSFGSFEENVIQVEDIPF